MNYFPKRQLTSAFVVGMALWLIAGTGCESVDDEQVSDDFAYDLDGYSAKGNVSSSSILSRAREWVEAKVPYCGGVNGGRDYICGGTCNRTGAADRPEWNPYRSDCSGFVSWAWGLKAPGLLTTTLGSVSTAIRVDDLQPGDALNSDNHVVLFVSWATKGKVARIMQEGSCGRVAEEKTVEIVENTSSRVRLRYFSGWYTPLRYKEKQDYSQIHVQINGNDMEFPGYVVGKHTYLQWGVLNTLDIENTCGNGKCNFAGKDVQGEIINGHTYLPWYSIADEDHVLDARKISDGWNFVWISNSNGGGGGCPGCHDMPY
jgi:hypothetical protein